MAGRCHFESAILFNHLVEVAIWYSTEPHELYTLAVITRPRLCNNPLTVDKKPIGCAFQFGSLAV